jgi:hypothetical protein
MFAGLQANLSGMLACAPVCMIAVRLSSMLIV